MPATYAQAAALESPAEILLFGGAAGGTKTQTLIADAVREAGNPNLNAIIFRESYPQLTDIIHKTRKFYEGPPYWGSYIASDHRWIFPENLADMWLAQREGKQLSPVYGRGASIKLGYLRNDDDCHDHDGQEYSFIGWDESTHHSEYQFRYLLSRLRSTDPTLFCRVRLASNPGHEGHAWHQHVFIGEDCPHCRPNSDRIRKPFVIYKDATFTDGIPVGHTTQFIPSRVADHKLFADPRNPEAGNEPYIRRLRLQKPALAKALEAGCWAQFQGQYFTCWDENRGIDVPGDYQGPDMRMVIPFADSPVLWWYRHFTGTDWGVGSSQAASYLCARTPPDDYFPNGRIYVLKEYCEQDSDIDEYPTEFINRFVRPKIGENTRKIVVCYLGSDSWANRGDGHTIAGQFQERIREYGLFLTQASMDREGGWQLIFRMLKTGELVICGDTCPQLLRAIPTRIHDPKKPGDIRKMPGDPLDDCIDALRYCLYSYVTTSHVEKPWEVRLAEEKARLDPTKFMITTHDIFVSKEDEDEPILYSRHARRVMRVLEKRRRRRR
jgi:hypothetical protein